MIESLERKLGEVEKRLKDAERRAAAAEAAAAEKESVINYVGEEVERVKGMFEQKVSERVGGGPAWLQPLDGMQRPAFWRGSAGVL